MEGGWPFTAASGCRRGSAPVVWTFDDPAGGLVTEFSNFQAATARTRRCGRKSVTAAGRQ